MEVSGANLLGNPAARTRRYPHNKGNKKVNCPENAELGFPLTGGGTNKSICITRLCKYFMRVLYVCTYSILTDKQLDK